MQYVDVPGYAALILRRTFRQLDQPEAIMTRSKEWLKPSDAHWNDDAKRWTFPSGATLTFGFLESDNDVYNYQGAAYQFVGWDELTQFSEKQYAYLFSRTRRGTGMQAAGIPIRHRAASNPGGIGHAWVKARFISEETRDPDAVFIPAKAKDNPGLDVEAYKLSLDRLDEVLRSQLRDGDWGIFEGASFPMFHERTHCVPAFRIPDQWLRFESFDHGVANPTAILAWAADNDGNLITFDSYYCPGLVSAHARSLLMKRGSVGNPGWWPRDEHTGWLTQSITTYADPSMWARTGGETRFGEPASVITEYSEHDVTGFVRANNDRRAGRIRLLELLRPDDNRPFPSWHPRAGELGAPRWFIVGAACTQLVDQLRAAPVNPSPEGQSTGAGEIVDPKWETTYGHACLVGETLIATDRGDVPIANVQPGDKVWTRNGLRDVLKSGITGQRQVIAVQLADGRTLSGTHDHPVWIEGKGFCPLASVRYGDKCLILTPASNGTSTNAHGAHGLKRTARFHRGITSTTATKIRSITISRISNVFPATTTCLKTASCEHLRGKRIGAISTRLALKPRSTSALRQKVKSGAASLLDGAGQRLLPPIPARAITAECLSNARVVTNGFARIPVSRHGAERHGSMTKTGTARCVGSNSASTDTKAQSPVLSLVRVVSAPTPAAGNRRVDVFNLTVDESPEYFANGILTHNCAAARYGAMSWQSAAPGSPEPEPDDPREAGLQRLIRQETERETDELDDLGIESHL